MKVTTAIILTVAIVLAACTTGYLFFTFVGNPLSTEPTGDGSTTTTTTTGAAYFYQQGGSLTINLPDYWSYDDASQTTNRPLVRIYHADKKQLFDSCANNDVQASGDIWISDGGILYLVLDHSTGTTYYIDEVKSAYVTGSVQRWDDDNDGTDEYLYTLDLKNLPALTAGESSKTISASSYLYKAEASPNMVGTMNVTSISTTSYNYYTAEGYVDSFTSEGYAIKIVKAVVTLPDSDNATYVDDGYVKFGSLSIISDDGEKITSTAAEFDSSSYKWTVDLGLTTAQESQEYDGKIIYNFKGAGTSGNKIALKLYCKFPSASKHIDPVLKLYYIKPDGSLASMTVGMKFSS